MSEATNTPTVPNPSGATCAPLMASGGVLNRMHELTCDLGSILDVTKGLADLLEEAADAGDPATLRALIRLARALHADTQAAHLALDHLWLDTSGMRGAQAAGGSVVEPAGQRG